MAEVEYKVVWKNKDGAEGSSGEPFKDHEEAFRYGDEVSKMDGIEYVAVHRREIPNWFVWNEWRDGHVVDHGKSP